MVHHGMKTSILLAIVCLRAHGAGVLSPDGKVAIEFGVNGDRPWYSVTHHGQPVLLESGLGLTLKGTGPLAAGMVVKAVKESAHSGSWKPVYGERGVIPEKYREAAVDLEERAVPHRRLRITFRAYDEGAALRYTIPEPDVITSEQTEFHIPGGVRAWETHGAQRQYENVWAKDIQPDCERPLTLEYPDGRYAALVEAGTWNYARMLFSPVPGKPGMIVSALSGGASVVGTAPFSTPWRAVIVGDRAGDLLERNYLLLNLNEPSRLADVSWIKPGKVIREVTLSTRGGKECVDFAARRNLQYIEYDAGWYGLESGDASDARRVSIDPGRLSRDPAYQGLDLPEVIRYAGAKNIGVLLYVNRRALEKQLDAIVPLYAGWGVKGIKFGFVNVGSQYWTKWLYDAVELAGRHKLMVDIHDEHRPTGLSRTLPNLLTQEGIAGNETMPPPEHNTVLPFTRFVAGAADYTICYFNDRIKTTRAHQLALAVAFYSPFQFMYWYDRPSDYGGEPEVEFFDRVPTVWDETRVVDGRIGSFATVARRSGADWFVGTINNGIPRRVKIPLSFLPPDRAFTAHIYENGKGPKDVAMSTRQVNAAAVIDTTLREGGGQAMWLEAR